MPTIGVCDVCASGFKEPTARSHTCQMFAWGAMGKAGNARTLNLRKGGSGFGIFNIRFRLLGFGFRVRGFQVSVHAEVSKRLIRVSGLGFRTC